MDGRYETKDLLQKIQHDEGYNEVLQRILSANTLIIDEIGMLSARLFTQVSDICKGVRHSEKPFGGIQIIAGKCSSVRRKLY